MAINVNTVYTTVLSILNKEQRGYLTPYEFGQLAAQAQLEIFEKFFEDYNQYIRMPKTDVEFASRMDHIREEFQIFEKNEKASNNPTTNVYNQPTDLHRFGSASWNKGKNSPPIEIISNRDYNKLKLSPLTQPTNNFPVAKYQQDKLTVFPSPTVFADTDVTFNYIRKPKDPKWGYSVGSLGQYLYDDRTYSDSMLLERTSLAASTIPAGTVGQVGIYENIPTTTSGVGTGALVNISITGTGLVALTSSNVTITVSSQDQSNNYAIGDTLTIASGSFTGLNNNITTSPILASNLAGTQPTIQGSVDFEISESQQSEVILKILQYSGIVIRDPQIVQAATQELQQEEVNSKR